MIKVLIAEDLKILRESLKIILSYDPEIEVIGCAADGAEALSMIEAELPDLILMDLRMPVCDGLECTRLVKEKYPQIKIVILTTFNDDESIEKALSYGANGYILKEVDPEEIIIIIKNTMNGLQVIDQNTYNKVLKQIHDHKKPNDSPVIPSNIDLTEREIEIIRMVVLGKSNKEIAENFFLSEVRIKRLISMILEKFKVEDRTQLAVYVTKNNIIDVI